MVSIGGRNVLHSATFTLALGEIASISAAALGEVVVEFQVEALPAGQAPRSDSIRMEIVSGRYRVIFPFLHETGLSFDVNQLPVHPSGATLTARVAAHNAAGVMIVHVDIFFASPSTN